MKKNVILRCKIDEVLLRVNVEISLTESINFTNFKRLRVIALYSALH